MRPFHIASTDPTTLVHLHSGRIIRLERLMRDRTFLNVGEASPTQDNVERMTGGALLGPRGSSIARGLRAVRSWLRPNS